MEDSKRPLEKQCDAPGDEKISSPDAKPADQSPPQKQYIRDYGTPPRGASRFSALFGTILVSLLMGLLIGLSMTLLLICVEMLTEFLWTTVPDILGAGGAVWLPLLICPIGGILIGLWKRHFPTDIKPLSDVMREMKMSGTYRIDDIPRSLISFLLPLLFGGSVGPEAGLTGFIAAGCSKISVTLRKIGLEVRSLNESTVSAVICTVFGAPFGGIAMANDSAPDERLFTYRKSVKILLYAIASGGAFLGLGIVSRLTGKMSGLPRFETFSFDFESWKYIILCILLSYLLAWVFHLSGKLAAFLDRVMRGRVILKTLSCGIVLGLCGAFLPLTLFSGEDQIRDIIDTWNDYVPWILILSAFIKAFLTPLCIGLGWKGGHIFPCIFSGAALGFGIASLFGLDPAFLVAISTAVFMGGIGRKPLLAIGLLLLCFPLKGILVLVIAAYIGALLPIPESLTGTPNFISSRSSRKK